MPRRNQTGNGGTPRLAAMDDFSRPRNPRQRRGHEAPAEDPAVLALTELILSERARAALEEPELEASVDPGQVWLLWFAIGATEAVCRMVERGSDTERNQVFRLVVNAVFAAGSVRSTVDPACADRSVIEIFESAGAEAVQACMRGDKRLGYYIGALRVAASREGDNLDR